MRQRLSIAGRFLLAVLLVAALFAIAGAEPARHLPLPLALLFWVISVAAGLALAVGAAALLGRWDVTRRLARWQLLGLAGIVGLLLYAPLSLGLEAMFPAGGGSPPDNSWPDRLEASGGAGALVAELLQAGPLYLLTWALLNALPAAALAPVALAAAGRAPAFAPQSAAPPQADALELVAALPARMPGAESAPQPPVLVPEMPGPPPATVASATEALGWPVALGDEVLCVTADLHYLHVNTLLGRATVLGSLAAVELHFGAAGLRIHRSHWVARRAIRRVARSAGGWRCELHDGQRLPISRRRVAEVRALLGADFVLDGP
jgi:hypothetical protein